MKSKHDNENKLLLDNYVVSKQLGTGSFGEVYLAQHKCGKEVALKIEDRKRPHRIKNEYRIYKCLHRSGFNAGLPKIYEYFQTLDYNIMVMQLLGPSLEDIFNTSNRKFDLPTAFLLAIQLIKLMRNLHGSGYIHRDIKPNNFLYEPKTKQVYIMDFGLSKRYLNDDKHIEFKNQKSFVGTARYAGVNVHLGIEPSRRDEMESIGYMLVYFLKGQLPWQGIKKQPGIDHIKQIGDKKMCTNMSSLCANVPTSFKKYLQYCKKLKFDETPDYDYLLGLFENDAKHYKIKPRFNWTIK